jgi:LysM repeat protein
MDQRQRKNVRTGLAVVGIAALCAAACFIAIAILIIRQDAQNFDPAVGVPVDVGGQVFIIYPDPAMSVKVVGEGQGNASPDSAGAAEATAQVGTGGQAQVSPDNQATAATLPQPTPTLPPPPPTTAPPSVIFVNYVVAPGDSLYRITQKQNTSIDLMASHSIASTNIIAGNSLLLPIANPAFCPGSRPHVVRDQQTISEIARAYNTTPEAIGAANGLDANYSVKTSQVICVPY